jgi:hypothetical protein
MTDIKVGDCVLYQKPSYTNPDGRSFRPMGIAGCKVVWLGRGRAEGREEEDFAQLEWQCQGKPEKFHAPLSWLTKD